MSNKIVVSVGGLHCKACELLSEDSLQRIKNVTRAIVNHKTGEAEIYYKGDAPALSEIKTNLEELGYKLNTKDANSEEKSNYNWVWLALGVIIIYWFISSYNFFDFSSFLGQQEFSLPLALLVGLVAGVSTCLALVGGLVLGVATTYSKNHPEATKLQKFQPHLLFNAGRVIGFFILGGILGLVGSTFKLSPLFNGILIIIVGLVILFMGLKLLNVLPALNDIDISLPKRFGRGTRTNNALILGALTFFLPCGFTQAMQIYALGTGSFINGGLVMALFALGTAPGLLGIGGLASIMKKSNSNTFFRVAGAIIIIFALINLNNGLKLIHVSSAGDFSTDAKTETTETENKPELSPGVEIIDNVQVVTMTETNRGYVPNHFTISKGMPVRWLIEAKAPYSCASALIVPSLQIQKQLDPGENVIEFTPSKTGTIPFSCSMGMYTGSFTVIDK
ncbi:MAG: sulfite exporter TauE/SafE family protein [Candidatus Falkowbacteria bacterium]